ncbi:hypothetical protein [Aeromicrobium sp.]|uniref:hypothetical protein n=1 Tax=Aeromicrobium sp. TaxID=1871063 RepID=UPI002FCA1542
MELREYIGFIWIDEEPGHRLRVLASSLEDARAQVVAEFGDGVISLHNEDGAAGPR